MLDWVVEQKQIEPHIPVLDKSQGKPGTVWSDQISPGIVSLIVTIVLVAINCSQKTTIQKASITGDESKHDYLSIKSA